MFNSKCVSVTSGGHGQGGGTRLQLLQLLRGCLRYRLLHLRTLVNF